jgi:hypothetical protein
LSNGLHFFSQVISKNSSFFLPLGENVGNEEEKKKYVKSLWLFQRKIDRNVKIVKKLDSFNLELG